MLVFQPNDDGEGMRRSKNQHETKQKKAAHTLGHTLPAFHSPHPRKPLVFNHMGGWWSIAESNR